jgi:hypothetical protein
MRGPRGRSAGSIEGAVTRVDGSGPSARGSASAPASPSGHPGVGRLARHRFDGHAPRKPGRRHTRDPRRQRLQPARARRGAHPGGSAGILCVGGRATLHIESHHRGSPAKRARRPDAALDHLEDLPACGFRDGAKISARRSFEMPR